MKNRNLEHSDDWATPPHIYKPLDCEFDFNFDPCPLGCTEFDGLQVSWRERNFVNPPYSRKLKEAFVKKVTLVSCVFCSYLFRHLLRCFTTSYYLMLKK